MYLVCFRSMGYCGYFVSDIHLDPLMGRDVSPKCGSWDLGLENLWRISVKHYICYTCLVLSSGMHLRFNIDVDNCYATYCHLSSGLSLVEISVDFCFYFFGL